MPDYSKPPDIEDLRRLAARRAIYRPTHAASDLGISYDSVNRYLNQRRQLFPDGEPGLKRRTEWTTFDDFLRVMWILCSLSPHICKCAHARIKAGNVAILD